MPPPLAGSGRATESGSASARGLLDSHCHLDDARYTSLEAVERRRISAGVRVLVPGTTLAGHDDPLRLAAAQHGWMYGVGLHPEHADPDVWMGPDSPRRLDELLGAAADGAAAIGECGLHRPERLPMESQVALLLAHLRVARSRGLPVILHCVRAHDVLPTVLSGFSSAHPGAIAGVIHSYSGGASLIPTYERLGLHLSFGGAITWAGARKPVDALRAVRADRLLLESDGPDQRPDLERACTAEMGALSEPAMLPFIAQKAATLRGTALPELLEQLDSNARTLGW